MTKILSQDLSKVDKHLPGPGGAPTRATTIESYGSEKELPLATGVLDYFPDALIAVSQVSFVGNQQHNPGEELHWARTKSKTEADSMMRHFVRRGFFDQDGVRHSAKLAWRVLAILQKELEAAQVSGEPISLNGSSQDMSRLIPVRPGETVGEALARRS